ncbi:MAG TPA: peptidase domain-containing ABC transporter [Longimicrobium sp.]|nr:peptidase domain-containing ABC transporter [Longimicrobium sp.]
MNQYRRLLVMLRPYWGSLARSILLGLVIGMVGMAPPYLSKLLIDEVYPSRDLPLMEVLVVGLLVIAVSVAAMAAIRGYFQLHVSARLGSAAMLLFFNHLQHLRSRFFEQRQVGEVMSRFGDVRQSLSTLSQGLGTVFVQGVYLVLVPPFLLLLEWRLALVALAVAPVTAGLTLLSARVLRTYYQRMAEAWGDFRAYTIEVLSQMRTLKVLSAEHLIFSRVRGQAETTLSAELHAGVVSEGFNMATTAVQAIGTAALTWYGWTLILQQEMTLGTYIAFMAYVGFFTQPLTQISRMFAAMQQSGVSLARMFEYLDEPPEQDPNAAYHEPGPVKVQLRGRVELRDVSFGYTADAPVLEDINLVIHPGELTAVVGQSGAGKSSLLRLVCRFEEPVDGYVLFDGRNGTELPLSDVRRQISVVWQDSNLLRGTIWENLTFGTDNPGRIAVDEIVGLCRLDELLSRLPKGYETPVAEFGASLSGGQRQRILLARALIRDTPILLMDEATSNIDQQTEGQILADLFARRSDRTTIYVTHRVSTVQAADRICVMRHGRIVGVGSHESLTATCDTYVDMVNAGGRDPGRMQPMGMPAMGLPPMGLHPVGPRG